MTVNLPSRNGHELQASENASTICRDRALHVLWQNSQNTIFGCKMLQFRPDLHIQLALRSISFCCDPSRRTSFDSI